MGSFFFRNKGGKESGTLLKSTLLTLFIFIIMFAGAELFWRSNNHKPSIVDDMKLWSVERDKIEKGGKNSIILLGASRMLTDFSPAILKANYPEYIISNLAISGQGCISVLNDLANSSNFNGTAICDITEEVILRSDDSISFEPYKNYFHNNFKLNTKINREITTFLQSEFAIFCPYLNLLKVAGDFAEKHRLRTPRYVVNYPDRSVLGDFALIDTFKLQKERLQSAKDVYAGFSKSISTDNFFSGAKNLEKNVNKIRSRGGDVVFVRFPTSGEYLKLDEYYFPKSIYWDKLSDSTNLKTINSLDYPTLRLFHCPDYSHIDKKDVGKFTVNLIGELRKMKVLK